MHKQLVQQWTSINTCIVHQGLAVLGHRVMETVGRDITDINFSRGFAIELGSTLSVVLASVAGKPQLLMFQHVQLARDIPVHPWS